MPENAIKQERERRIIESARKHSDLFPPGTLVMADGPDGRIPSATLGIEVSELLPGKLEGASFSILSWRHFNLRLYAKQHAYFQACIHTPQMFWCFSRTIGTADVRLGRWGGHSLISLRTITHNNKKGFVCRKALVRLVGLKD
jgi:hypothetical protein